MGQFSFFSLHHFQYAAALAGTAARHAGTAPIACTSPAQRLRPDVALMVGVLLAGQFPESHFATIYRKLIGE
jgi:hypothetical protein